MANEIDVSKLNVYADVGVPADNIGVPKLNVYADLGAPQDTVSVSKLTVYAIVNNVPLVRRATSVSTEIGRFVRPS